MQHISTFYGQNKTFLSETAGDTRNYHWGLEITSRDLKYFI